MIILSLTIYAIVAIWFLAAETAKNKCIAMIVGVCTSSFFAPLFLLENLVMLIVCCVLGTLCVWAFHIWNKSNTGATTTYKQKNKFVAALICALIPTFGVQYFYLRRWTKGLLCVLFWWTCIPTILSLCQAIYFLVIPKRYFDCKYASPSGDKTNNNSDSGAIPKSTLTKQIFSGVFPQENCQGTKHDSNEESLNIKNIHTNAGLCNVKGSMEDFVVTVYRDNKRFDFYVKDGQLTSFRTPEMEKPAEYTEVG